LGAVAESQDYSTIQLALYGLLPVKLDEIQTMCHQWGKQMLKVLQFIKREFFEVLPPMVFFLIAFMLILATQRLILREYGLPLTGLGMAVIGALLVGKVVLIVDSLPFVNKFPDKPLLYNVVWKTFIYFTAALLVRYVERLVPNLTKSGNFLEANRQLAEQVVWPHFWLIMMWLAVLFFVYCSMRELVRAIGRDKVIEMFIGVRAKRVHKLD